MGIRDLSSLRPPPHANAEVHKRIMERLRKMTPQEILQSAVEVGIYTADGKLTEHYRSAEESSSGSSPAK